MQDTTDNDVVRVIKNLARFPNLETKKHKQKKDKKLGSIDLTKYHEIFKNAKI